MGHKMKSITIKALTLSLCIGSTICQLIYARRDATTPRRCNPDGQHTG